MRTDPAARPGRIGQVCAEPALRTSPRCAPRHGSEAPATDFTARLLEADRDGGLHWVGEGIARIAALDRDDTAPIEIDLHALARRIQAGSRLRLEIASASFPRFDRHPNRDVDLAGCGTDAARPAQHTIRHDAEHPSRLTLSVGPG